MQMVTRKHLYHVLYFELALTKLKVRQYKHAYPAQLYHSVWQDGDPVGFLIGETLG